MVGPRVNIPFQPFFFFFCIFIFIFIFLNEKDGLRCELINPMSCDDNRYYHVHHRALLGLSLEPLLFGCRDKDSFHQSPFNPLLPYMFRFIIFNVMDMFPNTTDSTCVRLLFVDLTT